MSEVCFPFPPPTLHLLFPLSQKGNSVPQLPEYCSLLSRWGRNNLKIHNFISFAVVLGVPKMTKCILCLYKGEVVRYIG
jgi:hypothetical protein